MLKSHILLILLVIYAVGLRIDYALAQAYPTKPVRIATTAPGSSADVTARLIAQRISGPLGQNVIVDNRGAGVLAMEYVAKAQSDGYTLLVTGGSLWTTPLVQKTSYDPIRDFAPVSAIETDFSIVAIHPSVAANNVKELIVVAKAKPGTLNYGSGGRGSSSHLAPALLAYMAGVNMVHVPYKGTGAALTSLLAGEVQLLVSSATVVAPHSKSGKLKALAVTSAQPSARFPELPTVAVTLPGYESVGFTGMFAPARTPQAIIRQINQEVVRFLRTPEAKAEFLALGSEPVGNSPEEFSAIIKTEISRLGKMAKDIGLAAE